MSEEMEPAAAPQRQRRRTAAGAGATTSLIPKTPAREAPGPKPPVKLYSIFALPRDNNFQGEFNARGVDYAFTYSPRQAELKDGKLDLIGRLEVRPTRGRRAPLSADNVRATLLATQGGISGSPARRQLQSGTSGTVNIATPNQKQEQAKAPETQPQARPQQEQAPATEAARTDAGELPIVDATGALGFVGAMYFRLSALNARALGVPVTMDKVQLNVRLAPESETERDLLWLYSDITAAAYGDQPNQADATKYVQELNGKFKT